MEKQRYSNHKKYYIPHHFVLLPLILFLVVWGIRNAFTDAPHQLEWILFSLTSFCILYLTIMLRQHYALGNQNRIVRLEFRLRYFEVFGHSSQKAEEKLSFPQLAALRFADDTEFKILLERALKEDLGADDIKRSIKNWQSDNMRV